jgi:hypothetical protein
MVQAGRHSSFAEFRNEDGGEVAVVLINPAKAASGELDIRVTGVDAYRLDRVHVTDRT